MSRANVQLLRDWGMFLNYLSAFDSGGGEFLRPSRRSFLIGSAAAAVYPASVMANADVRRALLNTGQGYQLRSHSGAAWTINPHVFGGKLKIDIGESQPDIVVAEFAGGTYPGTDVPADLVMTYDVRTDDISLRFSLLEAQASANASDWLLGRCELKATFNTSKKLVFDGAVNLQFGGRGTALFNPDWSWNFVDFGDCYLSFEHGRSAVESAELFIKTDDQLSLIDGRYGSTTVFRANRPAQSCLDCDIGRLEGFADLSQQSLQYSTVLVELGENEFQERLNAVALFTEPSAARPASTNIVLAPGSQHELWLAIFDPRLTFFNSQALQGVAFLANVHRSGVSQLCFEGCTLDFNIERGRDLLTLSASGDQPPQMSINRALRTACLPLPGCVSLPLEQSPQFRLRGGAVEVAGDGATWSVAASTVQAASVIVQNPRLHIIRPEDRLDLIFELTNLQVRFFEGKPAEFTRIDHDAEGQIAVYFSGQHLAEQVFFATATGGDTIPLPPVQTRLSGSSRLVFDIVGDAPLPFSLNTLLGWNRFVPSLVDPVRPPSLIVAPTSSQTAIEAPFRLYLSPDGEHRWTHSITPVVHNGRSELWHTRLVRDADPSHPSPLNLEPAAVRAVWSPDYDGSAVPLPFDISLTPKDRKDIVTVTHDADVITTPVEARTLLLSGFGAFLDLEGRFPYDCHDAVSLERWLHQATFGQDNKVITARRGYLYPFGHRVTLLTLTTRESANVQPTQDGPEAQGAYLRQRIFIVIRERVKSFQDRKDAWSLPFASISIDFPITPPLDKPEGIAKSSATGQYWGEEAFWPSVDGNLLNFPVTGVDWSGTATSFKASLLFIEFDASAPSGSTTIDPASVYLTRLTDVKAEYTRSGRSICAINGSGVSVSPSRKPNDTAVDVVQIQFEGGDDPLPVCPTEESQFKLITPKLQARLPALKGYISDDENLAWFALADLSTTAAEIFLVAAPPVNMTDNDRIRLGLGGQTEKSGGISSPSLGVGGMSRIFGSFGEQQSPRVRGAPAISATGQPTGAFGQGKFDPSDYLDTDATICGCIRFKDFIKAGLSVVDAQIPRVLSRLLPFGDVPPVISQSIEWDTAQLQNWPSGSGAIFVTQQDSPDLVVDGGTPTHFYLSARAEVVLDGSAKPKATVYARLTNFSAQLLFDDNGVLIRCRLLEFTINETGHTTFNIDIVSVELVGLFLSFIQAIENFIQGLLGDSGISITISSLGVVVTLPPFNVPAITMGAFNLQNLSIGTSVELSFRSEPIRFRYNFSTPESPFLVSVGVFGGGGQVTIVTDIHRVVLFSASFTFGAFVQLDLVIASGSAGVLGGLTYTSQTVGTGDAVASKIDYDFYVHAYGSVTAFGFISVGVDFYLTLTIYQNPSYSEGKVDVSYSVKIGFFKKSFTLTYSRRFNGSGGGGAAHVAADKFGHTIAAAGHPATLQQFLSFDNWVTYRRAFYA